MYAFTASAFNDLAINRVLLLYISADGHDTHLKNRIEQSYDFGGVKTNNRREENSFESSPISSTHLLGKKSLATANSSAKEVHAIFPGDLYPFLRKPLFLIIDSNNSVAFQHLPNLFGQPFVSLLSPVKLPSAFHSKAFYSISLKALLVTVQ